MSAIDANPDLEAQRRYAERMVAGGYDFGLTHGEAFVRGIRDLATRARPQLSTSTSTTASRPGRSKSTSSSTTSEGIPRGLLSLTMATEWSPR